MKPVYKEKYPNLFRPLILGKNKIEIKNRIFTAPMGCPVAQHTDGRLSDYGVYMYGRYAKGGFGLVNAKTVLPVGPTKNRTLNIQNENYFMDVHFLNEYAHAFGAKTGCELYHQGSWGQPQNGELPISSTSMVMPNGTQVRGMNPDDMEEVAQMYADAAALAKRAGFDSILLHYGHGWLISSFLSPLYNHRTDAYGGSPENRMRFPRMVIERIRQTVGDDLLIDVRMSGSEMIPGGIEIEDTIEYVKMIEDVVDSVHITCGNRNNPESRPDMHPSHYLPSGHNAENSFKVKQSGVKIPVGVVGGISEPALAEKIIAEGMADFVLMARQATVDPDWVEKVRHGREEDIRPCMRCNYCIDTGRRGKLTKSITYDAEATFNLRCAADPTYAQGYYKKTVPLPTEKKKVAVVGGGVAGLEAAMTAAQRGHQVTLYEKEGQLGGALTTYVDYMWFKRDTRRFLDYLIRQCEKTGVCIRMNCAASAQMLEQEDPDAIIVAVGAKPVLPPIPGADLDHVMLGEYTLMQKEKIGKRVVIIGGGQVGCEISIILGEDGHEVQLYEGGEYIMGTAEFSQRIHTRKYMEKAGVTAKAGMICERITPEGVFVKDQAGEEQFVAADTVILATGGRPLEALRESFRDLAFDVINVGDCVKPSNIAFAVRSGYDAALRL